MTISTEASTFEYAREWLLSSDCFLREAMLADAPTLDASREQARARIHREETDDRPNEEDENDTAPDAPPPVNARPRVIIVTRENRRRLVGTATWAGSGALLICVEVLIPEAYQVNEADDSAATKTEKLASGLQWARQLHDTIQLELMETNGKGAQDGTRYLNVIEFSEYVPPSYAEEGESRDYIAWIDEVNWY